MSALTRLQEVVNGAPLKPFLAQPHDPAEWWIKLLLTDARLLLAVVEGARKWNETEDEADLLAALRAATEGP